MRTGGGKSLTYQLPALYDGRTRIATRRSSHILWDELIRALDRCVIRNNDAGGGSATTGRQSDQWLTKRFASCLAALTLRIPTGGGVRKCLNDISSFSGRGDERYARVRCQVLVVQLTVLLCLAKEWDGLNESKKEMERLSGEIRCGLGEVLRLVGLGLTEGEDVFILSLKVLRNWVEPCKMSLSELYNWGINGNSTQDCSFLSRLINILSFPYPTNEEIVITAAKTLTALISQSGDYGSATRQRCVADLLQLIPVGFLISPYKHYTSSKNSCPSSHYDTVHALVEVGCTLANEEIETISQPSKSTWGSSHLINSLLLPAQTHPSASVALMVFEVWLELQEIPTAERHKDLTEPLFQEVLTAVAQKVAYPAGFVSWEEEYELEKQDFDEVRRSAVDVLTSCYFLLRVRYLELLSVFIDGGGGGTLWQGTETALFCIASVSRDVCQRATAPSSRGGGGVDEKRKMTHLLSALTQQLCAGGVEVVGGGHALLKAGLARYLGSYAVIWNSVCDVDSVLQLLHFLSGMMATVPPVNDDGDDDETAVATAKAIKSILVTCSAKLAGAVRRDCQCHNGGDVAQQLSQHPTMRSLGVVMSVTLGIRDDEAALLVVEGGARLCVRINDPTLTPVALALLATPLADGLTAGLTAISNAAARNEEATLEMECRALAARLKVLKQLIRFGEGEEVSGGSTCDNGSGHPLRELMSRVWPVLGAVASDTACRRHEEVLEQLLGVHGQLLAAAPSMMEVFLADLITFVVQAYEETHLECTLDTISIAVEYFGSEGGKDHVNGSNGATAVVESFARLLSHLTNVTCNYVVKQKPPSDCPELIRGYFDMTKRYLLFCPAALLQCTEFATIVSFATACLTQCQGERDSTRATLHFLSRLFMFPDGAVIDASLPMNGSAITVYCLSCLTGSSPQMLLSPASECLFSLLHRMIHRIQNEALARQWVEMGLSSAKKVSSVGVGEEGEKQGDYLTPSLCAEIMRLLFKLIQQQPDSHKGKPAVKMLLDDFGKICKGEMTVDSLISHDLTFEVGVK